MNEQSECRVSSRLRQTREKEFDAVMDALDQLREIVTKSAAEYPRLTAVEQLLGAVERGLRRIRVIDQGCGSGADAWQTSMQELAGKPPGSLPIVYPPNPQDLGGLEGTREKTPRKK